MGNKYLWNKQSEKNQQSSNRRTILSIMPEAHWPKVRSRKKATGRLKTKRAKFLLLSLHLSYRNWTNTLSRPVPDWAVQCGSAKLLGKGSTKSKFAEKFDFSKILNIKTVHGQFTDSAGEGRVLKIPAFTWTVWVLFTFIPKFRNKCNKQSKTKLRSKWITKHIFYNSIKLGLKLSNEFESNTRVFNDDNLEIFNYFKKCWAAKTLDKYQSWDAIGVTARVWNWSGSQSAVFWAQIKWKWKCSSAQIICKWDCIYRQRLEIHLRGLTIFAIVEYSCFCLI